MESISNLLDKARKVGQMPSDNQLALRLKITRQSLYQWRSGASYPSDEKVTELAKIAGESEEYWLASMMAERSNGRVKSAWERAAVILRGSAAAAVIVISGMLVFPTNGHAETGSFRVITAHCILC